MSTTMFNGSTGLLSKNIMFATVHAFNNDPKEVWGICHKETTDLKYDQFQGYEGFGAAPKKVEGANITPVTFKEGYKTIATQKTFAYESRVTWEQRAFSVKTAAFAKQVGFFLGRSANLSYNFTGADILNNGFTDSAAFHGGDSKPLFSASHPWKMGGTYSNVLSAGDLSKTTLESGLKTVNNAKMENNIPASMIAKKCVIGYENIFQLPELLDSEKDPESGNNAINAIRTKFGLSDEINHYIDDTDAFYIYTNATWLAIIEAQAPFVSTENYPSKNIGTNIWMSFTETFKDTLGVYGNQGS